MLSCWLQLNHDTLLSSFSAHFFPSAISLMASFHLPPAVCGILGSSSLCTLPCLSELSPSTNLCLLLMQVFQISLTLLCLHLSGWKSCPVMFFPWERSVASRNSAWLKDMLMFFLHQGGSSFPDCLSLELTVYLFLSASSGLSVLQRGSSV